MLLLSFINPACQTISCPAIGPEFRQATQMLGRDQVELAGVVLSPADCSVSALQAFDCRTGLPSPIAASDSDAGGDARPERIGLCDGDVGGA